MSNWLSRAFARFSKKTEPKTLEVPPRPAANTNKVSSVSTPHRRRSSPGPSYGSRSSGSDSGTYWSHGSWSTGDSGSYDGGGSCGGSDGGGGGGGGGE